ncbi:MFS general substrate transporter [Cucurbitaria berberidis CBS 394.84]|uniref:MFS general substrate transporter n=1 Tax=Cucurbitaria berberidis CBS 394.84 TaxID=1168544 RepID=A0A9P4GCD1_9PLEO|nr:MFS general substrate transporter [Cucurbitaria berberidis CBS 394.84]KAF1843283.1 MFS general substrate transporter [Cucurbitaria berberidis CBS 394.84]
MFGQQFRSSKAFVKIVVCMATFTDIFLYGLIVPVLPFALSERLGLPDDMIQRWNSILLGIYGAAILLGSLLFGYIGDRMRSRQSPFVFGLLVLGGATALFAAGTSLTVLIIARILQGASTAIVFTVGFALLVDKIGREQIGEAMGYTSMSMFLGLFSGPLVGGIIYRYGGYFAVFIPAFCLIGLEILLRFLLVEEDRYTNESRLLDEERLLHLPRPTTEHRPHQSSILVLLSSPRLIIAMIGLFTINSFTTAFEGVLPVYVKELFHVNSMQAALLFLSLTIPMLLAPLTGKLVDQFGVKWPAVIGFGVCIPSLLCLGPVVHNTVHDLVSLVVVLFFVGVGVSLALPPMMTEVTYAMEEQEEKHPGIFGPYGAYSQAYGLTNAAFAGGALVGPVCAGFLRVTYGWPIMSLVMGCLSAVVMVLCLFESGGKLQLRNKLRRTRSVLRT